MDWIGISDGPCDDGNEMSCSIQCGKFLDCLFTSLPDALVRLFG